MDKDKEIIIQIHSESEIRSLEQLYFRYVSPGTVQLRSYSVPTQPVCALAMFDRIVQHGRASHMRQPPPPD